MTKRIALMCAVFLMSATMIFGSGQGEEEGSGATGEKPTITFTTVNFASPENVPQLTDYVEQFTEETGIKVDMTVAPENEYRTKLLQQAAANNTSDVALVDGQWIPEFAKRDYLVNLSPWWTSEFENNLFAFAADGSKVNGEPMAIWWHTGPWSLYYRQDLLSEAGYSEPPKTWDELVEVAQELTVDRNGDGVIDTYGLGLPGADNEVTSTSLLPWFWGSGGRLVNDAGEVAFHQGRDREAMINMLSFIDKLVHEYKVVPESIPSLSFTDVEAQFSSGEVAMAILGNWHYASIQDTADEQIASNIGLSMIPAPEGQEPVTTAGGWAMGMFAEGEAKQEAAWKWMEYWTTSDIQKVLVEEVGQMTAYKPVYETESLRDDTVIQRFYEQLKYGHTRPAVPFYGVMSQEFRSMVQAVASDTKEPAAAVDEGAQKTIEKAKQIQ